VLQAFGPFKRCMPGHLAQCAWVLQGEPGSTGLLWIEHCWSAWAYRWSFAFAHEHSVDRALLECMSAYMEHCFCARAQRGWCIACTHERSADGALLKRINRALLERMSTARMEHCLSQGRSVDGALLERMSTAWTEHCLSLAGCTHLKLVAP